MLKGYGEDDAVTVQLFEVVRDMIRGGAKSLKRSGEAIAASSDTFADLLMLLMSFLCRPVSFLTDLSSALDTKAQML